MKKEQLYDQVTQDQLHAFADKLRQAMAAELTVCIVQATPDDALGELSVACGISAMAASHHGVKKAEMDAAFAMLLTVSQILEKMTGGQVKVMIRSPRGDFPIEPGTLNKWLVEEAGK